MAGLLMQPDLVSATLGEWAKQPFVWGDTDCGLSVLAYAESATGLRFRPAPIHRNKRQAVAMLRAAGGFEAYCAGVMVQLGCGRTTAPERGDVGLVDLPGSGLAACLCLGGNMWAARGDSAIVIAPMTPVAAWRVLCPRP